MKKEIFLFILLLSSFVTAVDSIEFKSIDEKEDVIVLLKDDAVIEEVLDITGLEPKVILESVNAVSAKIDNNTFEVLKQNENVLSIEYDLPIKAFLDKSVPLINATSVHNLLIDSQNILGSGSACIIDTGVAYNITGFNCSTDTFLNGTCSKVPIGIDYVNNDLDPMDDNGHGTHVSWIANSVAPGSKVVSVKILDKDGGGSLSDLSDALNFCLNNVDDYNISVVSMSLGTSDDLFNSYCDTESGFLLSLSSLVNQLVAKDVVVLASSGNDFNTTHLPAPACLSNVTAVAASNDDDIFYGNSNRNSLVKFVAPGVNIVSYWKDGLLYSGSGTSMAAPHLAGAILLIQHFNELQYGTKFVVSEVLRMIKENGVSVNDAVTGLNFTRVDVYSALEIPEGFWVSILTPENVTYNFHEQGLSYLTYGFIDSCWMNLNGVNQTCGVFNATEGSNYLEIFVNTTDSRTNSSSIYFSVDTTNPYLIINSPINGSMITSENINLSIFTDANSCYYNITGLTNFDCKETNIIQNYGNYEMGVFVYDSVNNTNNTLVSFSFAPEFPIVNSLSPENNLKIAVNSYNFSCSVVGEKVDEVSLYGNFDGVYEEEITETVSGIDVLTNFTRGLNSGVYSWSCSGKDMDNDIGFSNNRTLTVDLDSPVLDLLSPNQSANLTSNPIEFKYNVTDLTSVSLCELYIDGVKSREDTEVFKEIVQSFSDSLSNGDHSFFISCIDEMGHGVNSSLRTINVNVIPESTSTPVASSSGGGGGGGGGSSKKDDTVEEVVAEIVDKEIPDTELEQESELSETDSAEASMNSITGLVTSDFAENLKGVSKVIGYAILSLIGIGVILFGGARLLHHDWESDDVGMKMQAKMFIQDKYNWIKDKLKRKDQFDGKDGSQF